MTDFTQFICYELKLTVKRIEKYLASYLEGYGVNFTKSLILFCLLEEDGMTLSEISVKTGIENSSLTTMVDKLEKSGLVMRGADISNRRVTRLYITAEGGFLAEKVLKMAIAFNHQLQAKLGQELEQDLKRALELVGDSLEEDELI